jgi:hypothetical protein
VLLIVCFVLQSSPCLCGKFWRLRNVSTFKSISLFRCLDVITLLVNPFAV